MKTTIYQVRKKKSEIKCQGSISNKALLFTTSVIGTYSGKGF